MGGLKKLMAITFYTYAAGMLALCGFPLLSGFWSKDAILHAASAWSISRVPFYLGSFGALLTAVSSWSVPACPGGAVHSAWSMQGSPSSVI